MKFLLLEQSFKSYSDADSFGCALRATIRRNPGGFAVSSCGRILQRTIEVGRLARIPWRSKSAGDAVSIGASAADCREYYYRSVPLPLQEYPDLRERLEKTLAEIDDLARDRNAAIHTYWAIDVPGEKILPYRRVPSHNTLLMSCEKAVR